MLQEVATFNNEEITIRKNKYKNDLSTISQIDLLELKILLGLLYNSVAMKSNHLPTRMISNTERSGTMR